MRPQKSQAQVCSTAGLPCKPQACFLTSVREGQQQSHAPQGQSGDKYMGAHMSLQQHVLSDMKTLREAVGLRLAMSPSLPYKRASLLSGKPQATRASNLEGEVRPKAHGGIWTLECVLRTSSSLAETRAASKDNLGCNKEMK